jgi:hypothetical protein
MRRLERKRAVTVDVAKLLKARGVVALIAYNDGVLDARER